MGKQKRREAASKLNVTAAKGKSISQREAPVKHSTPASVAAVEQAEIDDEEESGTVTTMPFRFFDLPAELRLRIYQHVLSVPDVIDLNPVNHWLVSPRLSIFLVCRRMHDEAYHIFYRQPIRLYPTHGRFFHSKKPLLARLSPRYRHAITTMELRLGPGWSAPPRGQNTNQELGLADCTSLRKLSIFVECDPSESVFAGFRGKNATEDTYKCFCLDLLRGIFEQVPSLEAVEVDAYPSVKRDAPLIAALQRRISEEGKLLLWGPSRGWDKAKDDPGLVSLQTSLAGMNLSDAPLLVTAQA